MRKPLLAITMGAPAGIGPEVIVGAWSDRRLHDSCHPVVVGHPEILRRAGSLLGMPQTIAEVDAPADADPSTDIIPCVRAVSDNVVDIPPRNIDARGGQAAYDALVAATHWALNDEIDGLVTAPLNKAALVEAGHNYPGHTELLAEMCKVDQFAMMLYLAHKRGVHGENGLGVVHVTLHMALADVLKHLDSQSVQAKIALADTAMRSLGCLQPRIGVCALNPHAGEEGLFGDEERTIIAPAVEAARAAGFNAHGPFPTDTLMVRAQSGEFDAVVAMYHDQGHIALKLLGMHRAVNVTLGLPIVRTSVAHGTAFDLAWQGRAESTGMIEAVTVAAQLAIVRRANNPPTIHP